MTKGIKLIYKNGDVDYFDPCDEIIIDNGLDTFNIKADTIKHIETYEDEEDDRKLRWRDEPPDKEGRWWHKFTKYQDEPLIGITEIWDINGELIVYMEGASKDRTLKEHLEIIAQTAKVQWAGPIPFPTD